MTFAAIAGGDGGVPEPDWSSLFSDELDQALASEQFGLIVREMRDAGTLASCNAHMIRRLVLAYVNHDVASRRIAEQGAVIKAKRTSVPSYNPWWTILQQASSQATTLEADLGLSPRRRSQAGKVERRKKAARAADAYLKPVGK